jgi:hypothetical protein
MGENRHDRNEIARATILADDAARQHLDDRHLADDFSGGDECLIKIAEKMAETKSAVVPDQGGILLVKISMLPEIKCE